MLTGGDCYDDSTSEILLVFKKQDKITAAFPQLSTGFPMGHLEGIFGGLCGGKLLVGYGKDVYERVVAEDKWEHIQTECDVECDRSGAKGCILSNMILLCGGELKTKVELLRIKNSSRIIQELPKNCSRNSRRRSLEAEVI